MPARQCHIFPAQPLQITARIKTTRRPRNLVSALNSQFQENAEVLQMVEDEVCLIQHFAALVLISLS